MMQALKGLKVVGGRRATNDCADGQRVRSAGVAVFQQKNDEVTQ